MEKYLCVEEFKYKEIKLFEITEKVINKLTGNIPDIETLKKLKDKTFYPGEFYKKLEKIKFNEEDIKLIIMLIID